MPEISNQPVDTSVGVGWLLLMFVSGVMTLYLTATAVVKLRHDSQTNCSF